MRVHSGSNITRLARGSFSQPEFALLVGVPLSTIRNWEQEIRHPSGAAETLMWLITNADSDALLKTLFLRLRQRSDSEEGSNLVREIARKINV